MAHEILSIKLCELDDKVGRIHSRIHLSETEKRSEIADEIDALRKERAETEFTLRRDLKFSKAGAAIVLSKAYTEIEEIVRRAKAEINGQTQENENEAELVEGKILLAEYVLDFAIQAANHAVLVSMEAIDAQMKLQETERSSV